MGKSLRDTRQRTAILETLQGATHPMTPKEIQEEASETSPSLGIATVYRNLRLMLANQEIEAIEVPGHRACYMLPQAGHRTLAVCRDSYRVNLVDGLDLNIRDGQLPEGFEAEKVEIFIYGRYK